LTYIDLNNDIISAIEGYRDDLRYSPAYVPTVNNARSTGQERPFPWVNQASGSSAVTPRSGAEVGPGEALGEVVTIIER